VPVSGNTVGQAHFRITDRHSKHEATKL
jgi:hypothetical protein